MKLKVEEKIFLSYGVYEQLLSNTRRLHELLEERRASGATSSSETSEPRLEGEALGGAGLSVHKLLASDQITPPPEQFPIVRIPPSDAPLVQTQKVGDGQESVEQAKLISTVQTAALPPMAVPAEQVLSKQKTHHSETVSHPSSSSVTPWYYLGSGPHRRDAAVDTDTD
jgi:hypothetical protein